MVTASMISLIICGSLIRATPPCARMSLGTRSRACATFDLKHSSKTEGQTHHDSTCSSFFSDASLLSVDDVHDDASLCDDQHNRSTHRRIEHTLSI